MGDEGGKNADSKSQSNQLELDPLDNVPTPTMNDFDDGVGEEERRFYLEKFHDLKNVRQNRLHCTACDKHLGLLSRHINRYRMHPLLKTLVCISCQDFYNSGEFEKGEDGSELYCRWCGQGGQVYCCSNCPIVFCEKCIKRNFGVSKINEIETNDDWLCFSCNPKPLWTLRAKFWVLIIYCTFKNNQAQNCSDPTQKAALLRRSQVDESECCKKNPPKKVVPPGVDKRKQVDPKKAIVDNRPLVPTPDQKKSLSINEARQAIKRLGSPVSIKKVTVPSNSVNSVPSGPVPLKMAIPSVPSPMQLAAAKRVRMTPPSLTQMAPRFPVPPVVRPGMDKKPMPQPIRKPPIPTMYNGYNISQGLTPGMREAYASVMSNDNLNLSLDSLTQGIDLTNVAQLEAAAAALEVEEDEEDEVTTVSPSKDDDVQCLTPTPKIVPKTNTPNTPRSFPASLPSSAFNNIIQMTENDVTINEVTGGLKFKVDPSTLSSSKMYKLPDGRIFAVNHNPNMPGGYSATIVAVDEASLRSGVAPPRGRIPPRMTPRQQAMNNKSQATPPKPPQVYSTSNITTRSKVAMKNASGVDPSTVIAGSVEWFKFNIVDAIDVMNYVLQKLHKLRNSSPELRNKNVAEIKDMHQNFEQMLKTSCKRFNEVRDNLNQGFKSWLKEKNCSELYSDDEDDIQILPDDTSTTCKRPTKRAKISNNEPISLDEDSNDSTKVSEKENDNTKSNIGDKGDEIENLETKEKDKEDDSKKEDNDTLKKDNEEDDSSKKENGENDKSKDEEGDKHSEDLDDSNKNQMDTSDVTSANEEDTNQSKDESKEEENVLANGKCDENDESRNQDSNNKIGDESIGEDLDTSGNKDVDMETDEHQNSLSNLCDENESRDKAEEVH